MNILFTSSTPFHPLRGGVGRVTDTLCKELQKRGYQVFYLNADWGDADQKKYDYPASVTILPFENVDEIQSIQLYRKYLIDYKIDVVINQDALFVDFYNNIGDLPIKVISVIHNNPLINYNHLLNDLLTLRNSSLLERMKEIIYVGRLDNRSKKVGRLIKVWSKVGKKYSDWNLVIVGDGPDRNQLEELKKKYKVGNLTFEGFQSPIEYYKRASIICMTSSFEGFPMVLVEAMQFGCVPIAFDSFEAIRDVIIPEKTGELVKPFKIKDFVNKLSNLMDNGTKRKIMSDAAFKHVAQFDVNYIVDKWEVILKSL